MQRVVLRLILDVVLTTALALLFLALWQWLLSDLSGEPFTEAFRVLFNFMDVGLGIWVVLLIIWAIRGRNRGGGPSASLTLLFLLIGTVVNAIVVTIVGFIQGGAGPWLVMFAIAGGFAVLVSAAIVVPIVHRVVKDAPPAG